MENIDFNRLWQNYLDTLTNHYVDFNGRVGRPQFWYFVLVDIAVAIVVTIVASITIRALSDLYSLALLLPTLGLTVRRLQDTGKPGSWVLIAFVPIVLMIVLGLVSILGGALGMLGFLFVMMPIISLAVARCRRGPDLSLRAAGPAGGQPIWSCPAGLRAWGSKTGGLERNRDKYQRFENWKLRRALGRPYFLRSTVRGSRVRKPPGLRAARKPGS